MGNLTNAILDAILILLLGLGVRGAAIATVTSEYVKDTIIKCNVQYTSHFKYKPDSLFFSKHIFNLLLIYLLLTIRYLIAFILLWKLNEQVVLVSPGILGDGMMRYLKSGSFPFILYLSFSF